MQYRIFIGSPGGLEEERNCFREKLERYSAIHSEPRGALFHPVGWEDTVGGVGRPQELINDDLRQCDFAVFVLHDRWGSPTGNGYTSGTQEEWHIAEELYTANQIRNIVLFFKKVDPRQLRDPGHDLKAVLEFKKKIEGGKRHLFLQYNDIINFGYYLERQLANWLSLHERTTKGLEASNFESNDAAKQNATRGSSSIEQPSFSYWIEEANKLSKAETPDHAGALFCAGKALDVAGSDIEWAESVNLRGIAYAELDQMPEAIAAFNAVAARFSNSLDFGRRRWWANALSNKGLALGKFGRDEEAMAAYDDLLRQFDSAAELQLRERVARALLHKGITLDELGRSEEAIAVYNGLLTRFGTSAEPMLKEVAVEASSLKASMQTP